MEVSDQSMPEPSAIDCRASLGFPPRTPAWLACKVYDGRLLILTRLLVTEKNWVMFAVAKAIAVIRQVRGQSFHISRR